MTAREKPLFIPQTEIARMSSDFTGAYDAPSIQLFFSIRALARRINDAASAWLEPFGLTAAKYNYLAVLYANRDTGLSPTQIGDEVHTASGTVASMLKALEREQLVKRRRHESDGRSAIIRLTKRGERLFQDAARAHHENIAAVATALAPGEVELLLNGIVSVADALQRRLADDG